MNRRQFLTSTGLGVAAVGAKAQSFNKKARNVILYVVDDQGSTDAGCYGNPVIKTPGLDTLADAGTRYTSAYCTTPSCSASRSVILTGLHNHKTGQYGHSHSYNHFVSFPETPTLPNMLNNAGYATICAGKYHVAPEETYHFQHYLRDDPVVMAEQCRPFIESTERPFFLHFATVEPHRPFKRGGADPVAPEDVIVPPYLPDIPECREELAQYYMSVQRADSGLVRLIEVLKETGHWEDTLIIYCSDNGIAFPGAKTCVYDPGIRLPMVVRDPRLDKQGVVSDAMLSYVDITPTILDYCGLEVEPDQFHGRSFIETLDGGTAGWDEIYASHTFHEITMYYPMRVVRNRKHKLIWNIAHGMSFPFASDLWESKTWQATRERGLSHYGQRPVADYLQRPEFELYDIETDPGEVNNLAVDPDMQTVLSDLKARLKTFQKRTDDPWILKWEHE